MNKNIVEFIGTFFLVLVIGLTGANPIAVGLILVSLVYMGFHISGAHYNPAVSLAFFMRGKLALNELLSYSLFQILGAFAAGAVVYIVQLKGFGPTIGMMPSGEPYSITQALIVEFFFTFAIVQIVLQVAANPKSQPNQFYGISYGFAVVAAGFVGGSQSISGSAYNPATAIGSILADNVFNGGAATKIGNIWIYILAPLAGGALSAFIYNMISEKE